MLKRKKILLVSSAFHPEISPRSFRATELAKEFFRRGYDVTVFSKYRDYDYSSFLEEYPISLQMWSKPSFPVVPTVRIQPFSFLFRIVSRMIAVLFEYPAIEEKLLVNRILKGEQGYDLLISFAVPYPVHWGVASIISKEKTVSETWIADCGDPYMFARLDRFRKPFYFKCQELRFSRKCDYISVPFSDMKEQFYPEFISKIKVIPQGFDFSALRLYEGDIENKMPTFIFAGSIIPGKRDLSQFLDFLSSVSRDYLFIIYTNQKGLFNKYKAQLGDRLILKDYIDRISLIFEMSKVDFLVNVDTIYDNQNNTEAIPSKLIDYALSGRPILNIHSARLDEKKVIEFFNKDYSRRRDIDKARFDIRDVAGKFLDLAGL